MAFTTIFTTPLKQILSNNQFYYFPLVKAWAGLCDTLSSCGKKEGGLCFEHFSRKANWLWYIFRSLLLIKTMNNVMQL